MKIVVKILTVLFIQINLISYSQNLVPNPSFELLDTCPNNAGQIYHAIPWFNPTQGTPDYLNSCNSFLGVPGNLLGHQNAHSGSAYAGFFASFNDTSMGIYDYREYIEVKLDSSLTGGVEYFLSFYLSLADSMNFGTDLVGACFSADTIQNDSIYGYMLYNTAQIENTSGNFLTDKTVWIKISGSFIALGGEQFLTIGNFHNDFNTNSVPVVGGASPASSDWSGGYYYLDDVCLSRDSTYNETWTGIHTRFTTEIQIFPNPVSTEIIISNHPQDSSFQIINILGKEVASGKLFEKVSQIDVSAIKEGIYFLTLNNTVSFKIVISH